MFNRLKSFLPKTILWRLTFLNVLIIALTITVSTWALYHAACFLVEGIGHLEQQRQTQFNTTLFQYLLLFSVLGITIGSLIHFYLIKKVIKPIKQLIESTKELQKGHFPDPIQTPMQDELGELMTQYNALISQLKTNEAYRKQIVSDVSHELRTPLANLNGYLLALKSGVVDGSTDMYESLYAESKRMTSMIEQLEQLKSLDQVAAQSVLHKEEVHIEEQIQQCVTMFDWALKQADISLQTSIEAAQLYVHIEGIQQVLSNLIDNAIQYYEGPGHIMITGAQIDHVYKISVSGPSTLIFEKEAELIFDRFYRQDESRSRETGGSGLGLAISKQIVLNHGGKIGYEKVDGNNKFWFTIPNK